MRYFAFIFAASLLFSCTETKQTTSENTVKMAPKTDFITGTVQEIERGKDGYTAKILTSKNETYLATISIPNLKDPAQYKAVKTGDIIQVKGDLWNADSVNYITVRELILQ